MNIKRYLKNNKTIKSTNKKPIYSIVRKSVVQTRKDISHWKTAVDLATLAEDPKLYPIHNLYNDILMDALLTSQIQNRMAKTLKQEFSILSENGKIDQKATAILQNTLITNNINKTILETIFFGHSLIQFYIEHDKYKMSLIPRQNVIPQTGHIIPDYNKDEATNYRNTREYGSWILEFGDHYNLGLLNKVTPHVLFKKFAQSCWSELCEIYGIPPRVLKTDTSNPSMVNKAKAMMEEVGAAAWFIIDQEESFEFAKLSGELKGDVYKALINLCNNEISMAISGAIIGQDTINGSRSKDESGQKILDNLVQNDMTLIENYWNTFVLQALIHIGLLPNGNYKFVFNETENLDKLWERTTIALNHYQIPPEWIKYKFGIETINVK